MARLFSGWLTVFGVVVIAIAAAHFVGGQATYIGGGEVNATMDSDLRFFNVLFAAYGVSFVWAARDVVGRAREIKILGLLFFVGGLGRILAWVSSGAPSAFYVAMTAVELVVPVAHYGALRALTAPSVSASTGNSR